MPRPTRAALLLAQLGGHVSARFAERLAPIGVTPSQVAVLRLIGQSPGLSQQELAARLGSGPSRVVKLVDELEERGLVERRRSELDRRTRELYVSPDAQRTVARVRAEVSAHDAEVVGPLDADEAGELVRLLDKLAVAHGLAAEGAPGQRSAGT